MGTVQLNAMPVQPAYVEYVTPSIYRISTVYSVIAEPPSEGATQVIVTSVPEIAVTGAIGVFAAAGRCAGVSIVIGAAEREPGITAPFPEVDGAEAPKTFMACT